MEENKEKERMRKLTQSFEQKNEIFKEERDKTNSEKLSEEFKRLSALASGSETSAIRESQEAGFMGGGEQSGGGFRGLNQSSGVGSIADDFYTNANKYQGAQGNLVALKDSEALEISIKRTLNSGAPVQDIAFYDEINWNLAQLGFPSKLPQDIKTAILKLMS